MDLLQRQKEIQKASYDLLKERIEKLSVKGQAKDFAEAAGILAYAQKLIGKIDSFKQESLQEVLNKFIQQDNDYYAKKLGVSYKNIHDAIGKPLTMMLLNKKDKKEAFTMLKNSKKDFIKMDSKLLEKKVEVICKELKKLLGIDGKFYSRLQGSTEDLFLKEMPHRVALAIWPIGSKDLSVMLMGQILALKHIDSADADNTGNTRQTLGASIGEVVHERIAWRFLRDIEQIGEGELKKVFRAYMNSNFKDIGKLSKQLWTNRVELEVGQKLIDLAQEAEIITEYKKPLDEKGFKYFKPNKDFLEKMSKKDKRLADSASMIYKPMVIKPLDWEGMYGGGFLPDEGEEKRFELSLIKASSRKDREALEGKIIPQEVLDGINHIQKTAFCVNNKILEVLKEYASNIRSLKKKNRVDFAYYRVLRELLSSKLDIADKKMVYEHFKKTKFVKTKDGELTTTDKKRIDKAIKSIESAKSIKQFKLDTDISYEIAKYKQGFDTIISIADEMKEYEKFYFVWRMDFRGRIYPQQTLLHPQAGDLPKSLLLFCEKRSLDKEGEKWFFIHGANSYGEVDKEPFDKRIEWVKNNSDKILVSAKNYKEDTFWKKAGDPFKFLAFCFEYERYINDKENFKTGLPVAIDGSNNGFQHITALLRDIEGAQSVNVLPSYDESGELKVADFYNKVAKELKAKMKKEHKAFEKKKDKYTQKGKHFYKQKENLVFEPSFYFDKIATFLKSVEPKELNARQYYSTYIIRNFKRSELDIKKRKDIEVIEDTLYDIERKVRKDVGEDDLEELKCSMVDELEKLYKRAKRRYSKGELVKEKNGRVCKKEIEYNIEASSLYQIFLDEKLIKRGFVKKPVMTESYGSSTKGKARAILEDIEKVGVLSDLDEDERFKVALEITKLLEKALAEVSKSPQKYKKWMQGYAKEIVDKGFAVEWKTPLGLEVKQVEYKAKTVPVSIGKGRKVEFKLYTNEIDKNSHKSGFSPNYIHSLDATHLLMTINELKKIGINDIITVHDSFATHANCVGAMSKALRKTFVELHSKEILNDLISYFQEKFGVEKKEIPYIDKDQFGFSEVEKSEYFFS